jgi:hypothetical protein
LVKSGKKKKIVFHFPLPKACEAIGNLITVEGLKYHTMKLVNTQQANNKRDFLVIIDFQVIFLFL